MKQSSFGKNLPNLFVLGVQKCGTTTLADVLASHRDVYLPSIKETYFFIDSRYRETEILWLQEKFYDGPGARVRWRCDATPFYFASREALERIRSECDEDTRFLLVLRNPVARAYSHYQHQLRLGNESESFMDALASEPRRIEEAKASGERWWRHAYFAVGDYLKHLNALLEIIPREKLRVFLTEELGDADRVKAELAAFLEIDPDGFRIDSSQVSNPASMPRFAWLSNAIVRDNPVKSAVQAIVPRDFRTRVARRILEKNAREVKTDDMPADCYRLLCKKYLEQMDELEETLGIPLDSWRTGDGYPIVTPASR